MSILASLFGCGKQPQYPTDTITTRDGNTLTTIRRQRFTGSADQAFRYHKSEAQAIVPFVFANTLRYIVDRADERIDFHIWKMDAENKHLLGIETKCYKLDTMKQVGDSWNPVSR